MSGLCNMRAFAASVVVALGLAACSGATGDASSDSAVTSDGPTEPTSQPTVVAPPPNVSPGGSRSVALPPVPDQVLEAGATSLNMLASSDYVAVIEVSEVEKPFVLDRSPRESIQLLTARVVELYPIRSAYPTQGLPELSVGSVVEAIATANRTESDTLPTSDLGQAVEEGQTLQLAVLRYFDPRVWAELGYPGSWFVWSGTIDANGAVDYESKFEPDFAPTLDAVRIQAGDDLASINRFEALAAWAAELRDESFSDADSGGRYTDAFDELTAQPTREERWFAASPTIRAFDPEITPSSVFATASETALYIEVTDEAAPELGNLELVLRTDTGVSHLADLDIGSHPGQLFWLDGEVVEVVLTKNYLSDPGTVVATIDTGILRSDGGLIVTLRSSLSSGDAPIITVLDAEAFADQVTLIADANG